MLLTSAIHHSGTAKSETQAAVDAAPAAEASASNADAAQKIAEILARIEIDRRHDEMFPDLGYVSGRRRTPA